MRPGFDLDATAELAGYLAALGVTHLYTAPLLTATPGSAHGYDVVDHRAVNPQLGGEAGPGAAGPGAARGPARAWSWTSCPTTPASPGRQANPAWWDVLRAGPRVGVRALVRHRLGPGPAAAAGARPTSADALDDLKLVDGELRYYEHRFPIADGTGDGHAPRRCTTGSTTSW